MLESELISLLFARLATRYGSSWFSRFEGIPLDELRLDWARELVPCRPHQIAFALEHLPPQFPPDAGQFLAIARQAPEPQVPLIVEDRPPPNVERAAAIKKRLRAILAKPRPNARAALLERQAAGEQLDYYQRHYLESAQVETPSRMPAMSDEELAAAKRATEQKVARYLEDHPTGY